MKNLSFIDQLKKSFSEPLPGITAQFKMAPGNPSKYIEPIPSNAKIAAVMLLLYPANDQWHIILIKRSTQLNDKHSGQISLPGGKLEPSDGSLLECAKREVFEEIGLDQSLISPIGQLTQVHVYVSNFVVHPFVAVLNKAPILSRQQSEVAEILHVPLAHLQDLSTSKITNIHIHDRVINNVPYYDIHGQILWGATAMIVSEFLEMLS